MGSLEREVHGLEGGSCEDMSLEREVHGLEEVLVKTCHLNRSPLDCFLVSRSLR